MTINKQFYEDACKLIEKENAWIQGGNFGINRIIIDIDEIFNIAEMKKVNCWCYNGALTSVIITDDESFNWWCAPDMSHPAPEGYRVFIEHQRALNDAFNKYTGKSFMLYNDDTAKSGQDMANKVREIVAKMEG